MEALFVRDVMETDVITVAPDGSVADLYAALPEGSPERRQRMYPVIDERASLLGVVPWSRILEGHRDGTPVVRQVMLSSVTTASPDELLRTVADRMAHGGLGVLPVVDTSEPNRLVGLVTQFDLLQARQRLLEEERHAERVLTLRRAIPASGPSSEQVQAPPEGG